ncbi:MAG: hypothetical protein P1P83_03615 [Bacteroidales bacterium]|nr:hypothetical protein [Bacteroidales bacterium]MDT8372862.1 hypothetical protein [Bacteroidales bacterium]
MTAWRIWYNRVRKQSLISVPLFQAGMVSGPVSEPLIIPLNGLTPGIHTISVTVPLGKPEGSSFSHWNISGVLVGHHSR